MNENDRVERLRQKLAVSVHALAQERHQLKSYYDLLFTTALLYFTLLYFTLGSGAIAPERFPAVRRDYQRLVPRHPDILDRAREISPEISTFDA
jgi:hypothetical protein